MKCPNCHENFSDLRDLCPKCRLDLRGHKREKGIRITYPDANYQELLKKLINKQTTEDTPIFYNIAKKFNSINLQQLKNLRTPQLTTTNTASIKSETTIIQTDAEISGNYHYANNCDSDLELIETEPNASIEKIEDLGKEVDSLIESFVGHEVPREQSNMNISLNPQSSNDNHNDIRSQTLDENTELFNQAYQQTRLNALNSLDFELNSSQLNHFKVGEDVKLLFDMAKESIDSPDRIKKLSDNIKISHSRTIESKELNKQLDKITKAIENPQISLKASPKLTKSKKSTAPSKSVSADISTKTKMLLPANAQERLISFLFDFAIIVALSLFSFIYLYEPTENISATDLILAESAELLPYSGLLLGCFCFWNLIFPLFSFYLFGTTAGYALLGIRLLKNNQKKPTFTAIFVRCSFAPFSIIVLGWLKTLSGTPTLLHDEIAGLNLFSTKH